MDFGPELMLYRDGTPVKATEDVVLHVSPRNENFAYQEAVERLRRAVRADLKLEGEEPLPMTATIQIARDAMVGTVLHGWQGVEIDGETIADRDDAGELHEDNAFMLLAIPRFFELVSQAAAQVSDERKKEREDASGKSSPPSDGDSDTEAS